MTSGAVRTAVSRADSRAGALRAALAVAGSQDSVVLGSQLAAAGVRRRQIEGLLRAGLLTAIRPGAYLVGDADPDPWRSAVAAALVAGGGAVISHHSAAGWYRMPIAPDGLVHLSVVSSVGSSRQIRMVGVRSHRTLPFTAADVREARPGIRVTSPARTLSDLAASVPPAALARALDEALVGRQLDLRSVVDLLRRTPVRPGRPALLGIVAQRSGVDEAGAGGRPARYDSPLELRVGRALSGLGPFEVQKQVVAGGRVYHLDRARTDLMIAVEVDGWGVRGRSRTKFDSDRRRDNHLAAAGWSVVHLTSAMSDAEMRAAVVAVMLAAARGRPGPL